MSPEPRTSTPIFRQGEIFSVDVIPSIHSCGFKIEGIGPGNVFFKEVEDPRSIGNFATPAGPVPYRIELKEGQIFREKRLPVQLCFQIEFPESSASWKGGKKINVSIIYSGKEYVAEDVSDSISEGREQKFVSLIESWRRVGGERLSNEEVALILPPSREILKQLKFKVELRQP